MHLGISAHVASDDPILVKWSGDGVVLVKIGDVYPLVNAWFSPGKLTELRDLINEYLDSTELTV